MSTLGGMVGQQPNDKKQRRLVVFNGGRTPTPTVRMIERELYCKSI